MSDWDDDDNFDDAPEWDDSLIAEDEARLVEAQQQLEETENEIVQQTIQTTKPPTTSNSASLAVTSTNSSQSIISTTTKRKLFDQSNDDISDNNHIKDNNESTKRARSSLSSSSIIEDLNISVPSLSSSSFSSSRQYIFHHPPLNGNCFPVTDTNGAKYYLTREKEIDNEEIFNSSQSSRRHVTGLIDGNIRQLIAQIDDEDQQRALELSVRMIQAEKENKNILINNNQQPAAAPSRPINNTNTNQLWVDKYSPKRFTELLSPDSVNRALLSWVLDWDICVFGEKRQSKIIPSLPSSKHRVTAPKTISLIDLLNSRPQQRVLLLSGPAGLGKTTMAHIIAAHAGYSVIELNASDDRTEDALIEKVRGGVEYKESSWSRGGLSHGKPHCLILDEIDGVADTGGEKNAITALCKLVMAENQTKANNAANADDDTGGDDGDDSEEEAESAVSNKEKENSSSRRNRRAAGGAKKNRSLPPLRRPIICICNDPWIPALRPLRSIAAHFTLSNNNRDAMLTRMKFIAKSEKMSVEDRALTILIDRVAGDIRAAIHSMQFLHERHSGRLTVNAINGLNVGIKDMQANRRDLIDRIFTNESMIKKKPSQTNSLINSRSSLISELNRADDGDKIISILHSNYLSLPASDPRLLALVTIANAFSMIDGRGIYDSGGGDDGNSLWPYTALTINHVVQLGPPKKIRVETSSSINFNIFQKTNANNAILHSWLNDPINSFASSSITPRLACVEYLSHTLSIISPSFRPLPFAMLNDSERARVASLTDSMANLALTYRPDNSITSALLTVQPFILHPRIDQLMRFEFTVNISTISQSQQNNSYNNRFRSSFNNDSRPLDFSQRPNFLHVLDFDAVTHKFKTMMAREIEIAHMRKNEILMIEKFGEAKNSVNIKNFAIKSLNTNIMQSNDKNTENNNKNASTNKNGNTSDLVPVRRRPTTFLSDHSAKLKARNKPKVANNENNNNSSSNNNDADGVNGSNISMLGSFHFAFKEGFTQAVRRAVKHSYFM